MLKNHPQLAEINRALDEGQSPRSIAEWVRPGVDFTTIWRHARRRGTGKVQPEATEERTVTKRKPGRPRKQTQASVPPVEDPVLAVRSRVEYLWGQVTTGLDKTHAVGDLRAQASLINAGTRVAEVDAKLRQLPGFVAGGQQSPDKNTIIIVMPTSRGVRERMEQGRMLKAAENVIDATAEEAV